MQIEAFNANTESAVEEDRAGKKLLPSGIYEATIKLAYLQPIGSAQAKKLIVILSTDDTEITDGEVVLGKAGTNVCKDGKKLLPGFLKMNAMCMCATGADLGKQAFEDKDVEVFEGGSKKVVKKLVATTLIGKRVLIGLQKALLSRQQEQGKDNWVNTDKTYTANIVDKYFSMEGKTHKEILSNSDPVFITTWKEKYEGAEVNKVPSDVKPWIDKPAGSMTPSGKPANSIFSKKS